MIIQEKCVKWHTRHQLTQVCLAVPHTNIVKMYQNASKCIQMYQNVDQLVFAFDKCAPHTSTHHGNEFDSSSHHFKLTKL